MSMQYRISSKDCYNYAKCRNRVFKDTHERKDKKDEIDVFLAHIWSGDVPRPDVTRERFCAGLKDSSVVVVSSDAGNQVDTDDARIKKTKEAMGEGADYIIGGVVQILPENTLFEQRPEYIGFPDVLMKVEGVSSFGDYAYVPIMWKTGKGLDETDWGNRPSWTYTVELTFISYILEHTFSISATRAYIYNAKGDLVEYGIRTNDSRFERLLGKVRDVYSSTPGRSDPIISSTCGICPWQSSCLKDAERKEDVTLLFYLGEKVKDGLKYVGVDTLSDLASVEENTLIKKVRQAKYDGYFYRSFTDVLLKQLLFRARLYLREKKYGDKKSYAIREKPHFPDTPKEIHYDIEDDTLNGVVYMHGFWILEKGKEPFYQAFVMRHGKTEEDVARELWHFFSENTGVPLYHYSGHEQKTCKALMEKYNLDTTVYTSVFGDNGSSIDLYEWVSAYTDWPLTSYGLKSVCKFTGFSWSAEDAGGANSLSWYDAYLRGDESAMDKILTYNKEDCMATEHLKRWLIKHAPHQAGT